MADDGRDQAKLREVRLSRLDAFGQPRNRHADVCREGARARPHGVDRPIGVMPRLPQLRALLRVGRPGERPAAIAARNLGETLGLLGDALLGAVELDEQHRALGQGELGIGVARLHHQRVEQFDARDRNPALDRLDGRQAGRLQVRERAMPAGDGLRLTRELQRDLDDDPERPLRADEQPRQIVTGRGFLGA